MIWWLLDNWKLVLGALAWGAGIVVAWRFGGWRLVAVVATLGLASVAYSRGRKDERDHYEEHIREISEERQEAYDEIDRRGTDRNDAAGRLRDSSY